jgi:HPt (histidine-containing phosphotransfer) domain-containing protein
MLTELLAAHDLAAAMQETHGRVGTAGSLGATRLSELACRLEAEGQAGAATEIAAMSRDPLRSRERIRWQTTAPRVAGSGAASTPATLD